MAVTVHEAALACGLSRATIQRDVRLGCAGIVRPGEPGRGRGALLDLDEYRRWRDGRTDDDRVMRIAAEVALRTYQLHGGLTATMRRHSAYVLALYVQRLCAHLTGREPDELPAELLTLLNVSVQSGESSHKDSR
jgi:hypothetical protein